MLRLKKYQSQSLDFLREYLQKARIYGPETAYAQIKGDSFFKPFQPLPELEAVPYICLRLPTGGGKTLLSAHTIAIAGENYLEKDYPLTLWLVPTDIIRQQTLETLKKPGHPNREVLETAFKGNFRVFDIGDFRLIRPQDIENAACVVVATFAALKVEETAGRKVYAHDENLEPHFRKISPLPGMEKDQEGGIKFSFANLLNWQRPLVIIDEAHNAKTKLHFEVLKRINPACVIEYTATPASNSNILYSVSAAQLKAEEMIKLPIILSEHKTWEEAVIASIQTRQKLEERAKHDQDYIRPVLLFQAENKDQEITVDHLLNYLLENEGLKREEIAIATGDQRELDNINLFDVNCPIRYVITVQALKEGWDCPFAYVLCSVANTRSPVAVEQLLGRTLRMPYAQSRRQAELNQAYAFVSSQSWPHAISQMHDRLVNMGFEAQEAEEIIYPAPQLDLSQQLFLEQKPSLEHFDLVERASIKIEAQSGGYVINLPLNLLERLPQGISNKKDREEISRRIKLQQRTNNPSPSQKGIGFNIPQLCLNFSDGPELAEPELYLDARGWDLLDYYRSLDKDDFIIDETSKQYNIDLNGQKIQIKFQQIQEQLSLQGIIAPLNEFDICRWLDRRLRAPDIRQETLLEFIRRHLNHLLKRGDLDLAKLNRSKFILEKILEEKIAAARKQAYHQGFQACMFGPQAIASVDPDFNFSFPPDYPANAYYGGKFAFAKHYYPRPAVMNGEEEECAKILDAHPKVEFWVRNLDKNPRHAFWLPTSHDKFYPDFLARLKNGRILVLEYKGAHLANQDSEEKELIGQVWAEKSQNLFLMAWKNKEGRGLYAQIDKAIALP